MDTSSRGENIIESFIKYTHQHKANVLEVGYGSGDMLKTLDIPGIKAEGIDPKGNIVGNIKTHKVSAEEFSSDKLYHIVYMLRSFHHLNDPETAMANLQSMLAFGGKLFIVDWRAGGGSIRDKLHKIFKKRESHYTLDDASEIVQNSGLKIADSYETDRFFVINAENTHYTALFPIKGNVIVSLEEADRYIIITENTRRETESMPDYFNVLFSSESGEEEFELNRKGVKVYHTRGNILENLNFLKSLEERDECKWNRTCPVGQRTERGQIPPYWTDNYCIINNNECIRFQLEEKGEPHSDFMLPDGSIDKGSIA